MKHLIFTLLLFAACSKPTITYETKKVFYKLQEVDKDGKVITESETKSTEITIQNKIGDEGARSIFDYLSNLINLYYLDINLRYLLIKN